MFMDWGRPFIICSLATLPFRGTQSPIRSTKCFTRNRFRPGLLNPRTPEDLETICLKCLQKDPNQRFGSARELADELDRFLKGEPIRSRPVSSIEKIWRLCKRKPALASLTAASAFLLLVVAIGSPITTWRIRKSQQRLAENLYAADMKLVQLSLGEGNWGRARALLDSYVPAPGTKDLRGFEWHYFTQLAKGDQLRTVSAHSSIASAIAFAPDGRTVITASFDRSIKLWEYPSLKLLSEISLPDERVHFFERSRGWPIDRRHNRQFSRLSVANELRPTAHECSGKMELRRVCPVRSEPRSIQWEDLGRRRRPLAVWDTAAHQQVRIWPEGGARVEWSPDGKRLFSGPVASGIACYDLEIQLDRATARLRTPSAFSRLFTGR